MLNLLPAPLIIVGLIAGALIEDTWTVVMVVQAG
jgi:hypothetical protein